MSSRDEKHEKREARLRGSGTRSLELEGLSIALPEKIETLPRLRVPLEPDLNYSPVHNQTISRKVVSRAKLEPTEPTYPGAAAKSTSLRPNRKTVFSSEDEDEDEDEEEDESQKQTFRNSTTNRSQKRNNTKLSRAFKDDASDSSDSSFSHKGSQQKAARVKAEEKDFARAPDFDSEDDFAGDFAGDMSDYIPDNLANDPAEDFTENSSAMTPEVTPSAKSTASSTNSPRSVKREPSAAPDTKPETKRRRGRPKKMESEPKTLVVTRRSRRIVDNPSLRQAHVPEMASQFKTPRPLKSQGLQSLLPYRSGELESSSQAQPLSASASGKQKPMTVETERVFTRSTRTRRININTLDVLHQFVEEHTSRYAQNELVNEGEILGDFKEGLKQKITYLMDLHASTLDISQELSDTQREKNELRREILEIRKKHAEVGAELSRERRTYTEDKSAHQEFMAMANSLRGLRAAVKSEESEDFQGYDYAASVNEKLTEAVRIVHPTKGLQAQLRSVNRGLTKAIRAVTGDTDTES